METDTQYSFKGSLIVRLTRMGLKPIFPVDCVAINKVVGASMPLEVKGIINLELGYYFTAQ